MQVRCPPPFFAQRQPQVRLNSEYNCGSGDMIDCWLWMERRQVEAAGNKWWFSPVWELHQLRLSLIHSIHLKAQKTHISKLIVITHSRESSHVICWFNPPPLRPQSTLYNTPADTLTLSQGFINVFFHGFIFCSWQRINMNEARLGLIEGQWHNYIADRECTGFHFC